MSVENVKKFYKRIEEDEAFRTEIAKDETLKDVNVDRLITVATKHGYEFTEADFERAKEEYSDTALSDSELEKVAGGAGIGICFVIGYGWWADGAWWPHRTGSSTGFCLVMGLQ